MTWINTHTYVLQFFCFVGEAALNVKFQVEIGIFSIKLPYNSTKSAAQRNKLKILSLLAEVGLLKREDDNDMISDDGSEAGLAMLVQSSHTATTDNESFNHKSRPVSYFRAFTLMYSVLMM